MKMSTTGKWTSSGCTLPQFMISCSRAFCVACARGLFCAARSWRTSATPSRSTASSISGCSTATPLLSLHGRHGPRFAERSGPGLWPSLAVSPLGRALELFAGNVWCASTSVAPRYGLLARRGPLAALMWSPSLRGHGWVASLMSCGRGGDAELRPL